MLYLIFNEGYATTAGENLQRSDLTAEAIRLTRMVHRSLPDDDEVTGLLALMLLTDARRPARTDEHGDLVPMAEQDRSRWNAAYIREGVDLLTAAVAHHNPGPYQIQAAIAALHDEAPTAGGDRLGADPGTVRARCWQVSDNPVVALNHAVAVAMADGPAAGRARLTELAADPRIARTSTVLRRSRLICSRWPATRRRPRQRTRRRPGGAPASRSSATCTAAPPGWHSRRPTPSLLLPATICDIVTSD